MNRVWSTIQALAIVLMLLNSTVAGEVYTWTDADGNIHITDRPPDDNSPVESVIRFSAPKETDAPPGPASQPTSVDMQQAEQLSKQLKRLKERKTQLKKIIVENQASIAAAEKDAEFYRKRSGSSARRNEKSIERQIVVLNNNLTTYRNDRRYVDEDIAEIEKLLETIEQNMRRPGG